MLLEVGPGTTLCTLARANGLTAPPPAASLRHPLEDAADGATLTRAAGELWLAGAALQAAPAPAAHR